MRVSEIFTSIQGESTYAGLPCHFIRLSGCNLRCSYCDTQYAYDEGMEMTVDDIISRITPHIRLVEVTGGEPLMQSETPSLISLLLDVGFKVLIETNGSLSIDGIDERALIILDVKTPGSAMAHENLLSNIGLLKPNDEVKFVLTDRNDYEWAVDFINSRLRTLDIKILLSPVFDRLSPQILARWMIEDAIPARLNLQLHKFIWGHNARGV